MSMVGQSESDDIFTYELKANVPYDNRVLSFTFPIPIGNKNVDLITIGSLIFGIQITISSDQLCLAILILPHPTLTSF